MASMGPAAQAAPDELHLSPWHARRCTIAGICPDGWPTCGVKEAAKLNQCTGVWVEDCSECGAGRGTRSTRGMRQRSGSAQRQPTPPPLGMTDAHLLISRRHLQLLV